MVYQFGNKLELIVVRISVNIGIRKGQIFFILNSRITSMLQRLTLPCVYQPCVTVWIQFILDSRIMNIKSRLVMKSIQYDGFAQNVL
jgi:hypothetical protein